MSAESWLFGSADPRGKLLLESPKEAPGTHATPDLIPRNCLRFPRIQVGNATAYFLIPRALHSLVNFLVEAFHQGACQIRALLLGKRKRFLKQIESLLRHFAIITPLLQRAHRLKPMC